AKEPVHVGDASTGGLVTCVAVATGCPACAVDGSVGGGVHRGERLPGVGVGEAEDLLAVLVGVVVGQQSGPPAGRRAQVPAADAQVPGGGQRGVVDVLRIRMAGAH